jgi:hypothetical protein
MGSFGKGSGEGPNRLVLIGGGVVLLIGAIVILTQRGGGEVEVDPAVAAREAALLQEAHQQGISGEFVPEPMDEEEDLGPPTRAARSVNPE